jgi:hypothetical protein
MQDEAKIKALRDLIHSAQNSIQSAKKILNSLLGEDSGDAFELDTDGLSTYSSGDIQVVE